MLRLTDQTYAARSDGLSDFELSMTPDGAN